MRRSSPSLTPEEARQLHDDALVIDSQQPPATSGFLFTDRMRAALAEYAARRMTRQEAGPLMEEMAAHELIASPQARQMYLDFWRRSGVTVACASYSGTEPPGRSFEQTTIRLARVHAIVDAFDGQMVLVRRADDIERAHREGKIGLVLDFQNTTPFGEDLERVDHFRHLAVRMVQLTYNLRNLVGDGCTEAYQGGLSHYGREMVRRLNAAKILVDVSHCSEQVGWDALATSSAPVVVSHSTSKALCYHDRGKTDELAKAVADRGGYFGVVVIPGFLSDVREPTLDDFARHVEHLVEVCGIDHVGIGTDKAGPGPGTDSMVEYPPTMSKRRENAFDWSGFRDGEHRLTADYHLNGYENFSDWPNLTVHLAKRGFNEEELRKILGANFLRIFREVCG